MAVVITWRQDTADMMLITISILFQLTHWGRVTHICISKLAIIGSDNGLTPGRRQAIIWNNAGLYIEPLGTNFNEISIGIQRFSFKKMHLNMSSAKWRPFCLSLNVLSNCVTWLEESWLHLSIEYGSTTFLYGRKIMVWINMMLFKYSKSSVKIVNSYAANDS